MKPSEQAKYLTLCLVGVLVAVLTAGLLNAAQYFSTDHRAWMWVRVCSSPSVLDDCLKKAQLHLTAYQSAR